MSPRAIAGRPRKLPFRWPPRNPQQACNLPPSSGVLRTGIPADAMKSVLLPLLVFLAPLRAAELDPARIPATAKWQLHADLDAMRASGTGKTLFALLEAEHGKQLRAFKRMFSLHPLNDLRDITLYGDGKADHAVALIHGTFNRAHIEDVVGAAEGHETRSHGGVTVHRWKDKGVDQHAAFANPDLLVFSRQAHLLQEALDVLAAKAPAGADPFLQADGGRPLISASARLAEIELPEDQARLVRMVRTLRLAAHEHEGRFLLRMDAETADATDADRLRRMLDGVLAFAEASDPKLDGLDLQARLESNPDRPAMSGRISLPVAEWIALMGKAAAEKQSP